MGDRRIIHKYLLFQARKLKVLEGERGDPRGRLFRGKKKQAKSHPSTG